MGTGTRVCWRMRGRRRRGRRNPEHIYFQNFILEIREFSSTVSLTKYIRIVSGGGGYRNPGLLEDDGEEDEREQHRARSQLSVLSRLNPPGAVSYK